MFVRALHQQRFLMVLLLSTGCTWASAGEDGAKFDLDHWAPVGLGGVSATTTKYGLAAWGHRAPLYDSKMKVHRYLWKFNSERPEAPPSKNTPIRGPSPLP
jgi:hypothetical protein